MRKFSALSGVLALTLGLGAVVHAADDPYADQVETRHGLMLQMATDAKVLGAIAKGDTAYDAATATKAAQNIAAIASVISMVQFPKGSENGASSDSFAKPELWANEADFLQKITDLNKAAADMVTAAGTSGDAIKGAMAGLGGACKACHEAYRQPES
jgi:cytochrome c556